MANIKDLEIQFTDEQITAFGGISFLEDTLSRLKGKKVGLIRADSGFFGGEIFDYLENYNDGKGLNYIVACRFNNKIKMKLRCWGEIPTSTLFLKLNIKNR